MADVPTTGPRFTRRIATNYSLINELKALRGNVAQVIAYGDDGEVLHRITVADVHNRHVRVMTALESIPWEAVDLLDKKGGLIKRHKRNADDRTPAGDIEDLAPTAKVAELAATLNMGLTLMLKAQDVALARHGQAQEQLLGAHTKLLDGALKRLEAEEVRNNRERRTNYQLGAELLAAQLAQAGEQQQLQLPAEVDGDGQTMTGGMLEQMMPQLLRMAFARGGGGQQRGDDDERSEKQEAPKRKPPKAAPPKATNGHNKEAASSERRSDSAAGANGQGTS